MLRFKEWYIREAKEGKLLHATHAEDQMFERGIDGLREVINLFRDLRDNMQGTTDSPTNISVKWDGAPAVIFGINPENGKFFVGTKSVFNKTKKKIAYTNKDVDEMYGHAPVLAQKLNAALKYFPELKPKSIYQGDLMFTNDKKKTKIDGQKGVSFTPNTITYFIPDNTDLYNQIDKAKIGIIIHTEYIGKTVESATTNFNINLKKLKKSSNIWFDDAFLKDYSGTVNLTATETKYVNDLLAEVGGTAHLVKSSTYDKLKDSGLYTYLQTFINQQVREGKTVAFPKRFLDMFKNYIINKFDAEKEKKKTDAGKASLEDRKNNMLTTLSKIEVEVVAMFKLYELITELKIVFIRKFEQIKSVGTFLRTPNGFRITKPEGFCSIQSGTSILKLVDRLEFSRANFVIPKQW